MKNFTYEELENEELENMDIIELLKLAEGYGMTSRELVTYSYKQMIGFIHAKSNYEI